jgi:hypothetical protein
MKPTTATQTITARDVHHDSVTTGPNSPCADDVLHDVVTVYPRQSSTSLAYMRALYRRGMSTAEIAAKLCNRTEAEVYNAVFGRPFNGATP